MPAADALLLFTLTTFLVVLTPGPAALTVASSAARFGYGRSVLAILGVASANAVYFALSATGISALILASSTLFSVIKWAGVAYLLWIGAQALLSRGTGFIISGQSQTAEAPGRTFARGFVIEMANPKALLYFAALVPQFIDTHQPVLSQFLLFGGLTFLIDVLVYSAYSALASMSVSAGLSTKATTWLNRVAGTFLIVAGISMAKVER